MLNIEVKPWVAVRETATYEADAARLLRQEERDAIVQALAQGPEVGDVIAGTNGVRKWRFAMPQSGCPAMYLPWVTCVLAAF